MSLDATRILHCIWTLGSGGAERQLSYLAPQLARLGWDVHVAFAFGGKYRGALENAPITLHDLSAAGNRDVRVPLRLARLVRILRPRLMQTWLTQMDMIGGTTALLSRTPWILSERSSAEAYPAGAVNVLRTTLGRRATQVVANSLGGAEYWHSFGHPSARVIPNALPMMAISRSVPDSASDQARGAVLFAGRLSQEKNPRVFLSAMALPTMRTFRAVLCGAGPLHEEMKRLVQSEQLQERVLLAGDVDPIWPWMKAASVLVAPSFFEGNPNAVLEAAACGTPLVVSDIPAHRQILRDCSAIFVDPSDPHSVAQGIRTALTSGAARATFAKEDVAALDLPSIALRYDAVYRTLVRGD